MRVAIDLTPILAGGHNGGAKIMTLLLIEQFIKLSPKDHFIVLASEKNYAELATIKAPNVETIDTDKLAKIRSSDAVFFIFILPKLVFLQAVKYLLPTSLKKLLRSIQHKLHSQYKGILLRKSVKADLLFCPFTAPFFHGLNIPVVSVIYDLQSHYYPFFFNEDEIWERRNNFNQACRFANKLVCISDFVNKTVLENSQVLPKNVKTIPIRLARRLSNIEPAGLTLTLKKYQLTKDYFLLYPANFWQHKNHRLLFTAFNIYLTRYPTSKMKLVCTGADNQYKFFLENAIKEMGLKCRIILPSYLSDNTFTSLVTACRAFIFPSLYEGFGMPILEAMAAGKPVMCSNLTSLPEVAGNAALLFDPRKPEEMVKAIYRIEHETDLIAQLITLGKERVKLSGTEMDMAKEYLQVFRDVVQSR